ncbi:MAG TPA: beta-ketoacyl synthase chain length factor, partial [Gammaproteobacteria bacterium]|nr:beta-ketoacyl synthase chain length factor [Gammaproteobacteria bacterium]
MQSGLEILSWSFWSPETRQPQDWTASAPSAPATAAAIPATAIPALHRRRMSTLSKMAVQVALEATAEQRAGFLVFCSQHGELNRTREL